MKLSHSNPKLDGTFFISIHEQRFHWEEANKSNLIHIIWNSSAKNARLEIDGSPFDLPAHHVITTTFYHKVEIMENPEGLVIFSFNRQYYCIYDHDSEVSCNGLIFFGAQELIPIPLEELFQKKLNLLLEVFIDEFSQRDNIQGEMLVVLLKRLIIICTRLAKQQQGMNRAEHEAVEVIRKFHYLVDMNFRTVKTVKEYADLMFKSPKTLSNVFSKLGEKSPLKIIHERIILEARRLLAYTDKNVNEIAYELGFDEPATFFKMFKKYMKDTPQNFRNKRKKPIKGKIDI